MMVRLDHNSSNELFEELSDWNDALQDHDHVLRGPRP